MRKISTAAVGICKGTTLVFSAFESNGDMWTGEGPRIATCAVRFDESYQDPPIVHISMNMWDIGAGQNGRADIAAEDVTTDGFKIVFRTWGDTRVARVRAEWLAIGPVRHPDDFHGI